MKKKPPAIRFPDLKTIAQLDDRHWHNGGDIEIMMYARSLHRTAMKLVAALDLQPNPKTAWDACPVVLLYRQSVELYLKALVDEGGDFLKERTDSISLAKTHSLRWLAQIAGQIIKAVKWENEFKCEGIASLADFSAILNELEELDPVAVAVQARNRRPDGWVPDQLLPPNVVKFAKMLDTLIGLLDKTADALAATNGMMDHGTGHGIKPTIQ
jgi:hypothetical protein